MAESRACGRIHRPPAARFESTFRAAKRWLLVLLLFAVPRTAEARVAIANTGKTIWHLGDAPAEYAMHGMRGVGFMYERYGVFWIDFWRSDTYVPITDEDAARAGLRTPWSCHVPIGLVLVAIVLVFGLGRPRSPPARARGRRRSMAVGSPPRPAAGSLVSGTCLARHGTGLARLVALPPT